jgi:hypothetical protein
MFASILHGLSGAVDDDDSVVVREGVGMAEQARRQFDDWRQCLDRVQHAEHADGQCKRNCIEPTKEYQLCSNSLWHADDKKRRKLLERAPAVAQERVDGALALQRAANTLMADSLSVLKFALECDSSMPLDAAVRTAVERYDTPKCHVKFSLSVASAIIDDAQLSLILAQLLLLDDEAASDLFYNFCAPKREFDVSPRLPWPSISLPLWAASKLNSKVQDAHLSPELSKSCGNADAV